MDQKRSGTDRRRGASDPQRMRRQGHERRSEGAPVRLSPEMIKAHGIVGAEEDGELRRAAALVVDNWSHGERRDLAAAVRNLARVLEDG